MNFLTQTKTCYMAPMLCGRYEGVAASQNYGELWLFGSTLYSSTFLHFLKKSTTIDQNIMSQPQRKDRQKRDLIHRCYRTLMTR